MASFFKVKHLFTFFRSLSWTLNLNSSPNMKKKTFLLNSELFSFVQCFQKAILLKLIHERPSKRSVILSGHLWTNHNSRFDLGQICHVINCLVSLHWGLWWLATCIQPVWNAVVNTCTLSTGYRWEIQILEFHTWHYFNFYDIRSQEQPEIDQNVGTQFMTRVN